MNCNEEVINNNTSSMKNLHKPNKQIVFDLERNKYYLKMSNSKKFYESNKYGQIIQRNNFGQTGIANYKERLKTNTIDKLNNKIDDSLYHPQSLFFEGYAQFPRPIVVPFSNIKKIKLQKSLINSLRKTYNLFVDTKNRNVLNKKTNEGLCFYSCTINNIENKKNKQIILDNINGVLSYDEKNKIFNRNKTTNNRVRNALKKFKNKIISNSTNTIFGRQLQNLMKNLFVNLKLIIKYILIIQLKKCC